MTQLVRDKNVNYISQRRFFASRLASVGQYSAAANILETTYFTSSLVKIRLSIDAIKYRFAAGQFEVAEEAKENTLKDLDSESERFSEIISRQLRDEIENLKFDSNFERLSKKKLRIVVLGNSPTVKDHDLGKIIDECDIVVRCNNYVIEGYQNHVGSKTDFVFITPACMPNPLLDSIPGFKINCLCLGNFHSKEAAQERMNRDNGTKLSIENFVLLVTSLFKNL